MRERNPCVRRRLRTFGCQVRFVDICQSPSNGRNLGARRGAAVSGPPDKECRLPGSSAQSSSARCGQVRFHVRHRHSAFIGGTPDAERTNPLFYGMTGSSVKSGGLSPASIFRFGAVRAPRQPWRCFVAANSRSKAAFLSAPCVKPPFCHRWRIDAKSTSKEYWHASCCMVPSHCYGLLRRRLLPVSRRKNASEVA